MNYPNPCENCETGCGSSGYHRCPKWRMRFLTIWKQFNTYQIRQFKKHLREKPDSFTYEHPDLVRQYLRSSPCGKCEAAESCDIPCAGYYAWWDARMETLRKKYEMR